jgi:sensor domain CHASE-containing protein
MDAIKKILGIIWLALAALVAYLGLTVLGIQKSFR